MGLALGGTVLLVAAVYAAVMLWLREGWRHEAAAEAAAQKLAAAAAAHPKRVVAAAAQQTAAPQAAPDNSSFLIPHSSLSKAPRSSLSSAPAFSVLIAARDEAGHLPTLLAALAAQTYRDFEVLIADDHSTDGTAALLSAAAVTADFPLRVVALPPQQTGKKAALTAAQAQARAPWLVCTDADCRPGPGWLAAYAAHLARHPTANFISGPVLLTGPDTLFQALVGLEFAGLIGVGAACLARQQPTMCNGANLAYRRAAFAAVGGFTDTAHLASGDDEFLLHAIHRRFPGTAFFLAAAAAIVATPAPATLPALLRQRVRWASKWRHYRAAAPQRLALLVLAANVSLLAGLLLLPWQPAAWPWVAAAWLLKLGADGWFMRPVLEFLGRWRWLVLLPLLQLAYAPYALGVGLAGLRGGYRWKGRQVR